MLYFQLIATLLIFYLTSSLSTRKMNRFKSETKCGANAYFNRACSDSANRCAANCQQSDMCTRMCRPGCDCLPGFVFKSGQSGDCIRPEDCPKKGKNSQKKCGLNAHFTRYCSKSGNRCAPSCDKLIRHACHMACFRGCDCKPGFVFKAGQSGDCIRPSECPTRSKEDQQCGPNAGFVYRSDSSQGCAANCTVPADLHNCNYETARSGCDCVEGFVYKEGQNGDCILPEECPKKGT